MTILVPDMDEERQQTALRTVSGHIANAGGELTENLTESPWGRRRLAYTIRKEGIDYRDGYYVVWRFHADPANVLEIERELKLDTNVIRYLLVMDDPKAGSGDEQRDDGAEAAGSAGERGAATTPAATTPTEAPTRVTTAPAEPDETGAETPATVAEAARGDVEEAVEAAAPEIESASEPAPADEPTGDAAAEAPESTDETPEETEE